MKTIIEKHQDTISMIFENLSNWMKSCDDAGMTLKQFIEKFDKFTQERIEGLKKERNDA